MSDTPTPSSSNQEDVDKIYRLCDQMITAHSILRDRYYRWSRLVGGMTVFASAAVTLLALADEQLKQAILPTSANPDYLLSFFGFVALMGSLVELFLNWRDVSTRHGEAADAFSRVKLKVPRSAPGALIPAALVTEIGFAYKSTCDSTVRIPDRQFLKLKAAHRRKVEISKHIDSYPSASIWLTRARFWWRDNTSRIGGRDGAGAGLVEGG